MIMNKEYTGPEVDIWSMGVILYTMMVGNTPFKESNIQDLSKKILNSQYEIPRFVSDGNNNIQSFHLKNLYF